jgi:hypothetical protein
MRTNHFASINGWIHYQFQKGEQRVFSFRLFTTKLIVIRHPFLSSLHYALQNWLLGWYKNRHMTVKPTQGGSKLITLASFVDYDKASGNEAVVLNIDDVYFLQFNQAKGMNIDTEEKRNEVTVTEGLEGASESRAGLKVGNKFEVTNFQNSRRTLVVEVCESQTGSSNSPDAMVLSVGMGESICGQEQSQEVETAPPTHRATLAPTRPPTMVPTRAPTHTPTHLPTRSPTRSPTNAPTHPPTSAPTKKPTHPPTQAPTKAPTRPPTSAPTKEPTVSPSKKPTRSPTMEPTRSPTSTPTNMPSRTPRPTNPPTTVPTTAPTKGPTESPSASPTHLPTSLPTVGPTAGPSMSPTALPTASPTRFPTTPPTNRPTTNPSAAPTDGPTASPTALPTEVPTRLPPENEQITAAEKGLEHDSKAVESLKAPSSETSETFRNPLVDAWIRVADKTTWFEYFRGN